MEGKYRNTDYMYASARIRALEGRIAGRERLERMIEARSSGEILSSLGEYGFSLVRAGADGTGAILREPTLASALTEAYAELFAMTEQSRVIDFLRYPTDCNNVKAQIKCFSRGVDARGLMIDGVGTLSLAEVENAFREKDFSAFPARLAEMIPVAEKQFAETRNPQVVDLLLDRACYEDMLASAKASGVAFAVRLVETKIDLQNVITCVRLIRMALGTAGEAMLEEAYLVGGTVELSMLREALSEGEAWLSERLLYTRYSDLLSAEEHLSLGQIEVRADDLFMEIVREAKYTPFGAEVLIGYAIAVEYEVKNIRIILAAKDAGLAPDGIRERLRKSYV
ncbi:MAG: V-type ATPase subunit [Clostridia bacterium]|nr:V-type ATPase subunit [Clostridia bacterium]